MQPAGNDATETIQEQYTINGIKHFIICIAAALFLDVLVV